MARTGENIYKRKDVRWEGRYIKSYSADGKAKYGYVYSKTYAEVKMKQSVAIAESRKNIVQVSELHLFSEIAEKWLQNIKLNCKVSTYNKYRNTYEKQLKGIFGKYPISKISGEMIDKFTATMLTNGRMDGCGYYAYMLKKNTPKRNCKPAKPEELFTFATKKGWKKTLNSDILEQMATLIKNYNSAIKRISANKYAVVSKAKHKDIDRILYIREQDAEYDTNTLYGLFIGMDAERVKTIRKALSTEKWHLLPEEERYVFLNGYLPDEQFADYYDLFADFRNGGYRVLGDIICDIDDELASLDHSRLHFETDSEIMATLMNAYDNKPIEKTDREALAECCYELIKGFVSPIEAVKYVVALNKRNFLWDVLYKEVDKWVLKK